MAAVTDLTELEGAALSVVRGHRHCTAYRIKRVFEQSPSEFWSGSAGAVYPLVERLCKRGLIAENAAASDGRGKRTLTLTKNGEVALDVWFADLGRATAAGFDPLRTRLNMRSLMPQAAYGRFIEDVEAALVRQLDEPPAPPGDDHEWAQALYRLWLEARLDWIARARAAGLFTTTG